MAAWSLSHQTHWQFPHSAQLHFVWPKWQALFKSKHNTTRHFILLVPRPQQTTVWELVERQYHHIPPNLQNRVLKEGAVCMFSLQLNMFFLSLLLSKQHYILRVDWRVWLVTTARKGHRLKLCSNRKTNSSFQLLPTTQWEDRLTEKRKHWHQICNSISDSTLAE